MNTGNAAAIPKSGFIRLSQIIGNPKANPPVPPIIPVSRSTWWNWVRSGKAPKPVKLGPRISVWRADDLNTFIQNFGI